MVLFCETKSSPTIPAEASTSAHVATRLQPPIVLLLHFGIHSIKTEI